jgi:hypothetical protein
MTRKYAYLERHIYDHAGLIKLEYIHTTHASSSMAPRSVRFDVRSWKLSNIGQS